MSAVSTKYLALQITTTGSRVEGSSVLTVSPQSAQPIPLRHVFLKICVLSVRNTSCAKADPDPAAMRQARIAVNTKLSITFDVVFILFSLEVFILILLCYFLGPALFSSAESRAHTRRRKARGNRLISLGKIFAGRVRSPSPSDGVRLKGALKLYAHFKHYLVEGEAVIDHYRACEYAINPLPKRGSRGDDMAEDRSGQVTELLQHWRQGDEKALHALVPLVYKELHRLAHYHLQSERPDHTLQSTALVHEAYLRMMGSQPIQFQNRAHFIAVASRLMRQGLVDYARKRRAGKRDGGCRIAFEFAEALPVIGDAELLALDDALDELSRIDERQGKIVEMKFFGGLSAPEISSVLGISRATVDRDWATARVWLHRQMRRTA